MVMLSTLMLPGIVTMIPSFVVFTKIGWMNSWLPLIVPMLFAMPYNTFLLRQFYMTLPRDLDEAAKLDGCTNWGIFLRVLFPLTIPAVTAIVVFQFMEAWNDFMGPLLYLRDSELYTVSLGLSLFQGKTRTEWQLLMAASAVAMVPSLILFAVAQKYIIGGIALTGIKG
jgi:multiple sugar transport system permease protein